MKKSTREEMRELMKHNRRMEEQLEEIRRIKELQRLKQEQKQLRQLNKTEEKTHEPELDLEEDKEMVALRKKLQKKLESNDKMMKQRLKSADEQKPYKLPQTITGNNLKDFLTMVGLSKHYQKFIGNGLNTLVEIRNTKKEVFDSMGILLPDQIKMFKKLRAMGVK